MSVLGVSVSSSAMDKDQCLMHCTTIQSSAIRMLFEILKDILHDVNITFSPQGSRILTMDGSKVALVYLTLPAANYEDFKCPRQLDLGVNMTELWRLVKQAGLRDTVQMWVTHANTDILNIGIEGRDTGNYVHLEYKLLDINSHDIHIPEVSFPSIITMPSGYLQKIMRAMQDIGDVLTIRYERKKLILSCAGDRAKQTITIPHSDSEGTCMQDNDDDVEITAQFMLRYLVLFSKAQQLCTTMEIMMKQDYPLVLKYSVASLGELMFCLAQKQEEDVDGMDENDAAS